MRFASFSKAGRPGLAVWTGHAWRGELEGDGCWPGPLERLLAAGGDALAAAAGQLRAAPDVDLSDVALLPPLRRPGKIVCVGLNYRDHAAESAFRAPDHPTIFARFSSSLIGHGAAIVLPPESEQLDFEGELVAVVGRNCRRVAKADALSCIAGWSIFNDASIRDYQFRTPQWTLGKNFDATGAFGPWFVTADDMPAGAKGLVLTTRLNESVVQQASTDDMIFDAATLVSDISAVMTLEPGDLIVTGTPAGVGFARKPPLWMKPGDRVEVEITGLGVLRNAVAREVVSGGEDHA